MLTVVAGGGGTELQRGLIDLGMGLQGLYLLGTLARAEYQYACGQWVEGAGMAYLDPVAQRVGKQVAHMGQGPKAGQLVGLVDGKYLACLEVHKDRLKREQQRDDTHDGTVDGEVDQLASLHNVNHPLTGHAARYKGGDEAHGQHA